MDAFGQWSSLQKSIFRRTPRLPPHRLLRRKADFRFEIAVEMGLDGAQRILISFKAVDHNRTLERRNYQSGKLLCVDFGADFPRLDSSTDHRTEVAAPATQRLASTLAQH